MDRRKETTTGAAQLANGFLEVKVEYFMVLFALVDGREYPAYLSFAEIKLYTTFILSSVELYLLAFTISKWMYHKSNCYIQLKLIF